MILSTCYCIFHHLAQALLAGHASMSQFTTLSLLNTKSYTAALTVFPTNCGTFWMGLSQKNVKQAYTWFEQAIDQIDALELTVRSLVMASLQRDLQFSICVSYLAEQEDRVYPPTDAFLRHLISRMLGIAQESYYEFMTINLPLIATEAYSMNKHFHYSPLWRILHSVTGVNSWTLAILKVFVTIFYILLLPRFVLALMKTPESSMA